MITIERGKTYLVTGGSGFLGKKTIERIHEQGGNVITIARDEGKLIQLQQDLPYVEFYTGDIADRFDAEQVCRLADGIFHLAAFSEVRKCQRDAKLAFDVNVGGTINILEACRLYGNVNSIAVSSSDKASFKEFE